MKKSLKMSDEFKKVLMMTGKIPIPEENVKFIVKDLTPERILRYIDIEDRLHGEEDFYEP